MIHSVLGPLAALPAICRCGGGGRRHGSMHEKPPRSLLPAAELYWAHSSRTFTTLLLLLGTGKTSCLKALASHTKRSVINIPLSRIRTNQQLMSLMMDQQVRVSELTKFALGCLYLVMLTVSLQGTCRRIWATHPQLGATKTAPAGA